MNMEAAAERKVQMPVFSGFSNIIFRRGEEIHYIGGAEVLPAPLDAEAEAEMIGKLQTEDNADAKSRLIEHNLRLVVYIAKKFDNTGVGVEDLISIGTIGLIKAVSTFDCDKGTRFATYTSRCIENEILMYFRNKKKSAQDVYISDPIDTDKDGNALTLLDIMATDDNIFDIIDLRIKSDRLYILLQQCLEPRDRQILAMRYGLYGTPPLTQREVAKKLGISRSYVSRIEKRAILELRDQFYVDDPTPAHS